MTLTSYAHPLRARWARAFASAWLVAGLAGCGGGGADNAPTAEPLTVTLTGVAATGAAIANADVKAVNANGASRDVVVGNGATAIAGHLIGVHYSGSLANGTIFDANGTNATPLSFTLGQGQVIAGWDEGIVGMQVGGTRQLVIPPSLGYGPSGNGPIPGNAVLVFTVIMVSTN